MMQFSPWKQLPVDGGQDHLFAVGDIHGCARSLDIALQHASSARRNGEEKVLISLGDVVDRGPASLECLDLLDSAERMDGIDRVVRLPGNHEIMMHDALFRHPDDIREMENWLLVGGMPLAAEAVRRAGRSGARHSVEDVRGLILDALRAAPSSHRFLRDLSAAPTHAVFGEILFVHAGVEPGFERRSLMAGIDEHSSVHWAWTRDPFLQWTFGWKDFGMVVHGHTPVDRNDAAGPEALLARCDQTTSSRRINLDLGAGKACGDVALLEIAEGRYRIGVASGYD